MISTLSTLPISTLYTLSISIYTNNKRIKLTPDDEGKFLVPNTKNSGYSPLCKVTASGLVAHPKLKFMDPVLTLSDGSKLRVYQGGDPSALLTMAISICEKHDKKHSKETKKIPVLSKRRKVITILDKPYENSYVDHDHDDYDYPWCDPSLYDDSD